MKLRCQECCAVVLTTQNTEISINNEKSLTLRKIALFYFPVKIIHSKLITLITNVWRTLVERR